MSNLIIDLFSEFYRQFTNNGGYQFDLMQRDKNGKKTNQLLFDNFLKLLEKNYGSLHSLGPDFLIRYFTFSFYYWVGKYTKYKDISPSWILGKKSLKRFIDSDDISKDMYFVSKELLKRRIDVFKINEKYNTPPEINLDKIENESRKKFHNTPVGFIHCIENTTLFVNSKICFECKSKVECRKLLEKLYPPLFKLRCKKN